MVYMHHEARVETHQLDANAYDGHDGGDTKLLLNFTRVMHALEKSATPLEDGLLSALLCLKANESADTNTFRTIDWNR